MKKYGEPALHQIAVLAARQVTDHFARAALPLYAGGSPNSAIRKWASADRMYASTCFLLF